MSKFAQILHKKEILTIGLMSGTSMDGIDAALVRLRGNGEKTNVDLLHFMTYEYPADLRDKLLQISQVGAGSVEQICTLNFVVGEYFSDAALEICRQGDIDPANLDLIGSHGQTIHHLPNRTKVYNKFIGSTLQIGEPAVIANRTGILTVANFRSADMAVGGQGAPLIPYFDYLVFQSNQKNRVILNIGGISNFTVLKRNCSRNSVIAYDTGPGNMVINSLMKNLFDKEFDESGKIALSGKVSNQLLENLKKHPYFEKSIPKSTGREKFGDVFVSEILKKAGKLRLTKEDIIATVTELTSWSIADALKYSSLDISDVDELIVSGGGVHNKVIMASLKEKFNHSKILSTDDFGISSDAKEAICFAVLANETISGNPANVSSVTGAKRPAILGTISYA